MVAWTTILTIVQSISGIDFLTIYLEYPKKQNKNYIILVTSNKINIYVTF